MYTMGPGDASLASIHAATLRAHSRRYRRTSYLLAPRLPLRAWNDPPRPRHSSGSPRPPLDAMLCCARETSTVWRQRVRLSPDAFAALQRHLPRRHTPRRAQCVYHHFHVTAPRRRDNLDAITLGALRGRRRAARGLVARDGPAGFTDRPRSSPRPCSSSTRSTAHPAWEAMFLPTGAARVERRLDAAPGRPPAKRPARAPRPPPTSPRSPPLRAPRPRRPPAPAAYTPSPGYPRALVVWALSLASTLPRLRDGDVPRRPPPHRPRPRRAR